MKATGLEAGVDRPTGQRVARLAALGFTCAICMAAGCSSPENHAEIDVACAESIVWSSEIRLATGQAEDAATIGVVVDQWLKPSAGPDELTLKTSATTAEARHWVRMSQRRRVLVLVPVHQKPGGDHIIVEPEGDSADPYIDALDVDRGCGA